MNTCVLFDVDGVLLDSYRGIRVFYLGILPSLDGFDRRDGEVLYRYELYAEGLGVLRGEWWRRIMPWVPDDALEKLLMKYWEIRRKYTVPMPGLKYTLEELVQRNVCIGSVSYKDDIRGLKFKRMKEYGLDHYFHDNIVIVDDDAPSRLDGIHALAERHNAEKVIYVDDKPGSLWRIKKGDDKIITVLFRFPYPYVFPWISGYRGDYLVYSLPEILALI